MLLCNQSFSSKQWVIKENIVDELLSKISLFLVLTINGLSHSPTYWKCVKSYISCIMYIVPYTFHFYVYSVINESTIKTITMHIVLLDVILSILLFFCLLCCCLASHMLHLPSVYTLRNPYHINHWFLVLLLWVLWVPTIASLNPRWSLFISIYEYYY